MIVEVVNVVHLGGGGGGDLQDCGAPYTQHLAQAVKEGVHVLTAHSLYHFAAHHLVEASRTLHTYE